MVKKAETKMRFRAREEDFGAAYAFVENLLERDDVTEEVAKEALLVFEALFQKLLDSGFGEDTALDVSLTRRLGDLCVRVGFEGGPFVLYADGSGSIEDKILRAHDDKLDCSYRAGYNLISVSVAKSYRKRLFACSVAVLLAVAVYVPLHFLVDAQGRHDLLDGYVFPLEGMYANAVLMVGAPMTFFSLLKNLTDTYVVSQRSSGVRRLQLRVLMTSVVSVLLAIVAGVLWSIPFASFAGIDSAYGGATPDHTFADVVASFVPPSIFEPFEAISPIPLMVVALLATYALCSAGKHFDVLRQAMEACNILFSRMLHVVMAALPAFCFLAFMDVLLDAGFEALLQILVYAVLVIASLLLLFASYAVRLRSRGVKVIPFARKLVPLVRENLKIGSAIDAAPFNVRYCARTYGMDRARLERDLPVLAQINLDGNCFIIMLCALIAAFMTGAGTSWLNIACLAALVVFLSYGAPNQPGGILIGLLIVFTYLQSFVLVCSAIYAEALFGGAQNIVNVIGDIVAAAIDEAGQPAA